MSCFLFGVIFHDMDDAYKNWAKTSKKFDLYLYSIQKIGIEQELSIAMIHNPSPYVFDKELAELLPNNLKEKKNQLFFTISRSPVDYAGDNLFSDWEFKAAQDDYIPGKELVFKQLEKFFNQVSTLKQTQAIWLRYRCMFDSEVYHLDTAVNLEASLYPKYNVRGVFEIPDFEIYMEKQ
jgi:hypothetical protein